MAPREDVVSSAVTFLQDPSVASSALDKRIAFLQSKNLTQEEIEVSLARTGTASQAGGAAPSIPPPSNQYQQARQPAAGYGYGYGSYPGGPWMQPPPEPPRRDWRDWFIMATVTTGVGYGLYTAAQRYIMPLISPPTPPQLEQDKAHIDASFDKAFALIDQLTTDTAEIKASEAERTEKLDTTIRDVNSVVADLKAANTRREAESRIVADQVAGLRQLVPQSLEQWKQNGDSRLDELGLELQSLKKLLENRVGKSATAPTYTPPLPKNSSHHGGASTNGTSTPGVEPAGESAVPATGVTAPKRESSSPKRTGGGRAAIPAWQMAASSKSTASSANGEGSASEAGA